MERPFVVPYNIKYNQTSILPWHLAQEGNPDALYQCVGGEVVKMEYLGLYDAEEPEDAQALNELCRELFGMEFNIILAVWARRRHDLPLRGWYKVKMHLQWK